ncbi:hypothetical protein N9195_03110 [bacterium]|nr:hypothetical protein [bacterium]
MTSADPASTQNADPFVTRSVSNTPTGKVAASHTSEIGQLNPDLPPNLMLTSEAFPFPIEEAPRLCRGGLTHNSLLTTHGEEHSTTLENDTSPVCLPEQLATSQAVSEFIYPTELEPANDYGVR